MDSNRHQSLLHAAQEELYEEAQLRNGEWHPLLDCKGSGLLNDKYQQDWSYPFLVVNPDFDESAVGAVAVEQEELIEIRREVPLDVVRAALLSGQFQANQTSTLFMALEKLSELKLL